MTDPIPPLYKPRDNVLLNGVPSTVLSWPADNAVAAFAWFEQHANNTNSYTRLMGILGTDSIEPYDGPKVKTSLDEDALAAQAPADTIEETAVVAPVDPEPVAVVEDVPAEAASTDSK